MTRYRLIRPAADRVPAPSLEPDQLAVVDHAVGPLLVLAGPGTGKTTTLVEAIVDKVERHGVPPESVLALTFSRKAAEQLRDKVTSRLGRTMATSLSSTFHSFAYALLRAHSPTDLYSEPLRLLTAPEQDVALRELIIGGVRSGTSRWPAELDQAVSTRGFAREVAAVLARAREQGLDPADLANVAAEAGRSDWLAAAHFMEEYLTSLDFQAAIDYPELIHRAATVAADPVVRAQLRSQYSWVFVDEYQDTDTRQVALLQALAGDGRNLVAVGDPDQSIYAFRGAEVRHILDFPREFAHPADNRAPVVALRTTRRFGPVILAASRSVARGIPTAGAIDGDLLQRFRAPAAGPTEHGEGQVEVRLFSSSRAEVDHIADLLRRAHLEGGVGWGEMAVLVRSGTASIPPLRRALLAAGIPVEVAGDEIPLAKEPSVAPLLAALAAAADLDALTVEHAHYLLSSPLGGLDVADVRSLGRALRAQEREAFPERLPRPSGELLLEVLQGSGSLLDIPGHPAVRAARLASLLATTAEQVRDGAPVEQLLWSLWEGTPWQRRLLSSIERGAGAARLAHRDLDAICALFSVAARVEEKRGHTGVTVFLDELSAQEIPADTLADRGVRGEAVRVMTAHRSKGLEWRLVIAAGVQEGTWPDVRRRGSLLEADRIGPDGPLPPIGTATRLAEERRLFYVAATRARERFVATAVQSTDEDGDQPSRFLAELGVGTPEVLGRPSRPLSIAGLVAELRRTAGDPANPALQRAAAERLARLALTSDRDRQLVSEADPASWWGSRQRSSSSVPLRPADSPVPLSASALDALVQCPTRWFLEREAAGSSQQTFAQGFGMVLHALADRLGKGESPDLDALRAELDAVWDQLAFETPWAREKQRAEAHEAIGRLVAWHVGRPDRQVLASEHPVTASVTLPDGEQVEVGGCVDRFELDADGNVVVVDFKTSKSPPTNASVHEHPQLGLYQLAVDNGAVRDLAGESARSGGAELVQLRVDHGGMPKVQCQGVQQPDADGITVVQRQLMEAVGVLRSEELTAVANDYCDRCAFAAICPVRSSGTVLS